MAVFSGPFDPLLGLQQTLDAFRGSGWLDAGPSGGGAYPPGNVFRKGDEVAVIAEAAGGRGAGPAGGGPGAGPGGGGAYPPVNVFRKGDEIAVIAEVPGVRGADLEVQVKGSTLR